MVENFSDRKVFYYEGVQVYFHKYIGKSIFFNDQENTHLKEDNDIIHFKKGFYAWLYYCLLWQTSWTYTSNICWDISLYENFSLLFTTHLTDDIYIYLIQVQLHLRSIGLVYIFLSGSGMKIIYIWECDMNALLRRTFITQMINRARYKVYIWSHTLIKLFEWPSCLIK